MPHKLRREDDLLPPVDLEGEIGGHAVQLDDGKLLLLSPAEEGHDVLLAAPEKRQRLVHGDDLREEEILDIAEELFRHELIDLADLLEVQHVDLVGLQLLADGFPDALHEHLLLARDAQDRLDLRLRLHAGEDVLLLRREDGAVAQDAHAHAVELREVRLIDHQELQPLHQRHGEVRRLEQHALVECQPAQLPVDVNGLRRKPGRLLFFFFRCHNLPQASCSLQAFSSASMTMRRVRMRANFLSFDSMMNHGAFSVLVFWIISSMASS